MAVSKDELQRRKDIINQKLEILGEYNTLSNDWGIICRDSSNNSIDGNVFYYYDLEANRASDNRFSKIIIVDNFAICTTRISNNITRDIKESHTSVYLRGKPSVDYIRQIRLTELIGPFEGITNNLVDDTNLVVMRNTKRLSDLYVINCKGQKVKIETHCGITSAIKVRSINSDLIEIEESRLTYEMLANGRTDVRAEKHTIARVDSNLNIEYLDNRAGTGVETGKGTLKGEIGNKDRSIK